MATAYGIIEAVAERIPVLMEAQMRNSVNFVRGVEKNIFHLPNQLKQVLEILDAAEVKRYEDARVKDWSNRLGEAVYRIDHVLDEWDLSIRKFDEKQVFSCIPLSSMPISQELAIDHDTSLEMKSMLAELDRIIEEIDVLGFRILCREGIVRDSSSHLHNRIHGRDVDRDTLLRKIVVDCDGAEKPDVKVIPIVGKEGIGKTTLAGLVFSDSRVMNSYPLRIWVPVHAYRSDLGRITQDILSQVQHSVIFTADESILLDSLRELIQWRKYLLVLDDVSTEFCDQWEPLKACLNFGGKGSTILATARNQEVGRRLMGTGEIYHVGQLSDESCRSILSDLALFSRSGDEPEKFKGIISLEMAKKCNGIPRKAKMLGGLLCSKASMEEWETVLGSEIWELEVVRDTIFAQFNAIQYCSIPLALKCCFLYFGIIPRDFEVYAKKLIRCWSALGSLHADSSMQCDSSEVRGQEYLDILSKCHLVEDSEQDEFEHVIICKMCNILQDFAQFLRESTSRATQVATCQDCDTSIVSHIKEYHSLFYRENPPSYICDCLISLRVLSLRDCGLESIPRDMIKLIHLRLLDLSYNQGLCEDAIKTVSNLYYLETLFLSSCGLHEIPWEIGGLSQLSHLDLSFNRCLTGLPESICNLLELRTLELDECDSLSELPQGIHKLTNLRHLHNLSTKHSFPEGVGQLTNLLALNEFSGKLSLLKQLNKLKGSLQLRIRKSCSPEDVAEAKEAKLCQKESIRELEILFEEDCDKNISMGVLDALEPHSCLRYLKIELYGGSMLPGWIASPFSLVTHIELQQCSHVLCLPALGILPCLEELTLQEMDGLQRVGREFLGLSLSLLFGNDATSFPKLQVLIFCDCPNLEEWEDITAEEETGNVWVMTCLKKLDVISCGKLTVLPHRLLRMPMALQELDIYDSDKLIELYKDKEGSDWKAISQIPQVRFE